MADPRHEGEMPGRERVARFYRDHPDGSIRTFMVRHDGPQVVFEARVYRTPDEASLGIYTSGWAHAHADGSADPLERCESGAVARALAHLGYGDRHPFGADPAAPAAVRTRFSEETLPLFAEVA